jgi:sec-independent protein translocase protein TatC
MTTPPTAAPDPKKPADDFNPEEYRMSVGDHLEELRTRLIFGLAGYLVAAIVCFLIGRDWLLPFFLRPLTDALMRNNLPPQVVYTEAAEPFMVYIQIAMIVAAAMASPWLLYQLWQFVAAGLYPAERKYVTKFLPLSIVLMLGGMAFLYLYVLPVSVEFFFHFGTEIPLIAPHNYVSPGAVPTSQPAMVLPKFDGDPANPVEGQMWLDLAQNRLKLFIHGEPHVITISPPNVASPMITMSKYIDMVVGMLLAFGISFQMPLVVLALNKLGILDIPTLKAARRIVYFLMSIVAAVIIPDVITGMLALMIPLILLYELGIFLAWWSERKTASDS